MHEKPKLQCTRNYELFEMHTLNRDLSEKPILLASLKKHGFMPSSPLQCIRNGSGRLKIIRGHNRFNYAKRLGLAVWYVVDDSNKDIYDLEGDSSARWDVKDFLVSRAKSGDKDCAAALEFHRTYGINIGPALSLMAGESAGSGNQPKKVKTGTYKIAKDHTHAMAVVALVDACRRLGVKGASSSSLVAALSMALRVPEFDPQILRRRLELHPDALQRCSSKDRWLDALDALYNYGAKAKRFPLAFEARRIARERAKPPGTRA